MAGQLELRRHSPDLPLHQVRSTDEVQSVAIRQDFPQLALATVARRDRGHYSAF
jgi:hypothetical protein